MKSRLDVRRSKSAKYQEPLVLDGDDLLPVSVRVDGEIWTDWTLVEGALHLPLTGASHIVEITVELDPSTNTQLMGLYASGGMLCTQCEAEGFRRITFFPDRPDGTLLCRVPAETARASLTPGTFRRQGLVVLL
ncbi:MAG: hypothetical protein AAGF81_19820 [Pseudomonadota bacterium]